MTDTIYLIDGSGYIFRAYYAIAQLTNSSGFPTNALFGFSRMLLKLMREAESQHQVMVFDAGQKTFRNELYPLYKANRGECPAELLQQMPYFRKISKALGLPTYELPGYEADDVIGTLAMRLRAAGHTVVLVSGDKDLMQLVDDRTTVWDTMRDRRYDVAAVEKKFGVPPVQVVEVLSLIGDTSDNIPGLKGVGPKTAVQLIEEFHDIATLLKSAEVVENLNAVRNRKKIAEQLRKDSDILALSRRLVQIDCDVPLMLPTAAGIQSLQEIDNDTLLTTLTRQEPDAGLLGDLAVELEFNDLFSDFQIVESSNSDDLGSEDYRTILASQFDSWLVELRSQTAVAIDLETTSLDPLEAKIVGASFCWDDETAYYLPIAHRECPQLDQQIRIEDFAKGVGPFLSDSNVKKLGQNLKFDISVLLHHGFSIAGELADSMVAAYLLEPDTRRYKLSVLTEHYLGRSCSEFSDVTGDKRSFAEVDINSATNYAAQDAHMAWLLVHHLEQLLVQEGLEDVYRQIEMPLVPVLAAMELRGIALDCELLGRISVELEEQLEKLREELYILAGSEFNLNSPKQLSEVLFNQMGISSKGVKRTKTGWSTDSSVLERLGVRHELPRKILQYRGLFKLKSTYVDALPAQVSPIDGRLHSRFNQTVTGTGRLSSSDPNLQNIPIQSEAGRGIRAAFVAGPRRVLISADYSQIELRVLAHMSGDPNLQAAFAANEDIHARTARELLGISADKEVTPAQRRIGKTLNFGIVYGMGSFRLARELGLTVGLAQEYIDGYFQWYEGVRQYFEGIKQQASEQGFVTTLFGRKRIITAISTAGRDRGFQERAAINAPIQGTAADIIKLAMVAVQNRIIAEHLPLSLLVQVHDELVFEGDEIECEKLASVIAHEMEEAVALDVPLVVDVGWGQNWQEAH